MYLIIYHKHNHMKRIILICCTYLFLSHLLYSQKLITGKVKDTNGKPLPYVCIYAEKNDVFTFSDNLGIFYLNVDDMENEILHIDCIGYKNIEIASVDTIRHPLNIILKINNSENVSHDTDQSVHYWGFTALFQVDMIKNDFGEFSSLLGEYNTDLMNNSGAVYSWECALTYNRFHYGFTFGIQNLPTENHDSLELECNTTLYGLSLGYKIVNSKRLIVMPECGVKWYRYRLLNYPDTRKIPLNQYLTERDLDMRFNQTTGFIGLNLAYKIYFNTYPFSNYYTIGLYGGYIFKLNNKPWIYSRRNRLKSNHNIDMYPLNLGIFMSFHF